MNNQALIDFSTSFLDEEMYNQEFTDTYWLKRNPDWQSALVASSKQLVTDGIRNTGIADFDQMQVDETRESLQSYVSLTKSELDNSTESYNIVAEFFSRLRAKFCPRFPIC